MSTMCADMDESFKARFFGTHFFNPPRYMKLLEIIPHTGSNPEMVKELSNWIENRLGKGIVYANDTINFIANRIGVFNLQSSLKHMEEAKLNVETVDALTGKLLGRPPSATLRTMDVVGIDTFAHVARNVYDYAKDDPYRDDFLPPAWIKTLIEKGHLGQKTNSTGAYKKIKNEKGKTEILAYRPESGEYATQEVQAFEWMATLKKQPDTLKRIAAIIEEKDAGAQFIWKMLRDTMAYSALLLDDIASGSVLALDNGMKWGFNWEWGPFQIWQALGYDKIRSRMLEEGVKLPEWAKEGVTFYDPAPNSLEWHMKGIQKSYNSLTQKFCGTRIQTSILPPTKSS